MVCLLDAITRMHESIGQVAVIGEKKQPFTLGIEPADGIYALFYMRNQIDGPRAASGIVIRAYVARRFIYEPVNGPLAPNGLSVDADLLLVRLDLDAEVANFFAVNGDAPGGD